MPNPPLWPYSPRNRPHRNDSLDPPVVEFQAPRPEQHQYILLSEQLFNSCLAMRDHQKKIHFQKKTTQYLLSLCGDFALHMIQLQSKSELGQKAKKYLPDAYVWYRTIQQTFCQWSELDNVAALVAWRDIQRQIENILRSQPESIENFCKSEQQNSDPENLESIYASYSSDIIRDDLDEVTGNRLSSILSSDEDLRKILKLRGGEAQNIADLLDWVMDKTEFQSKLYRLCERALRRLCGRAAILPSSCYLREGNLKKTSVHPNCGGGFADVYEGIWNEQRVAVKVLRHFGVVNMKKLEKSFYREVVIWKRLTHSNIVPFLGVATKEVSPLCIVSSWMENGNLAVYLRRHLTANRLDLVVGIARGLQYLHKLQIVHGDVKSGNVLIDADYRARLSDFGLASVTHESRAACAATTTTATIGSMRWMAPEMLHAAASDSGRSTTESDIYAFAMTMYEAFTGKIPFFECPCDGTVVINVTLGIRPERPGQPSTDLGLSERVWRLMEECWQTDRSRRPPLSSILECLEDEQMHYVMPPTVFLYFNSSNGRQLQHGHVAADDDSDLEGNDDEDDIRYRDILEPTDEQTDLTYEPERVTRQENLHSHIEIEGTLTNVSNTFYANDNADSSVKPLPKTVQIEGEENFVNYVP